MLERIKKNWRQFKQSEPGHRFQDRYDRRQKVSQGRWDKWSIINIGLGVIIAIAGFALIPAPGPGWIVTFLGLGLLGGEFAPMARALEWVEVKARAVADWAKKVWSNASGLLKAIIVVVGLVIGAAVAYGAYQLVVGG